MTYKSVESWHIFFQRIAVLGITGESIECPNTNYFDFYYESTDGSIKLENSGNMLVNKFTNFINEFQLDRKRLTDIKWAYLMPRIKCHLNQIEILLLINNRSLQAFTNIILEIINVMNPDFGITLKYIDDSRNISTSALVNFAKLNLENFHFDYVCPQINFFMIKRTDNIEKSSFIIYSYGSKEISLVDFDFLFPTFTEMPEKLLNQILKSYKNKKILMLFGSCDGYRCNIQVLSK